MFTDTKNLANSTINTTNAAARLMSTPGSSQDEDKFKLKKMWKPIIRLMSRKSALVKTGRRENSSSIPNNVNLNNASQYSCINKDTMVDLDDTSYMAHKLPLQEFWQVQQQQYQTTQPQQQTSKQALEFISKASIDKTPLDTCTSCVYGRNCQHTQFHQTSDEANLSSNYHPHSHSHSHSITHQQLQNLNYYDAEEGCFVWCENSADIDENALREWLWQNSWQFAENATAC